MKRWKKVLRTNSNQKRAEMALLMSDKIDFKSKSVMRHSGTLSINNRVSST